MSPRPPRAINVECGSPARAPKPKAPRRGVPAVSHPRFRARISPRSVLFGEWFHYEKDLIWIEHGNQYDGANAFRTWLAPLLPKPSGPAADVDLPLGSLFVRYMSTGSNEIDWC